MSSIHDPRYRKVVEILVQARKQANMSQIVLAERVGLSQPDISKAERCERRLDIVEVFDFIHAISEDKEDIKQEIWSSINECCS